MASMLGLQSETVSRIYSEFSRAGYVSKLSSKRAALDLDALRGVIDRK
jgi:CRP-like cAMP-binding protein